MAKTINFDYEGNHYELEFSRDSIVKMENSGFNIDELSTKPMTRIPQLFHGAFIVHHKHISRALSDEIYDHIKRKQELVEKLVEMYYMAMDSLMDEDKVVEDSKKVDWQ